MGTTRRGSRLRTVSRKKAVAQIKKATGGVRVVDIDADVAVAPAPPALALARCVEIDIVNIVELRVNS